MSILGVRCANPARLHNERGEHFCIEHAPREMERDASDLEAMDECFRAISGAGKLPRRVQLSTAFLAGLRHGRRRP